MAWSLKKIRNKKEGPEYFCFYKYIHISIFNLNDLKIAPMGEKHQKFMFNTTR